MKNYKGLKVIKSNENMDANAWYSPKEQIIYYNDNLLKKNKLRQMSIFEHEFAHHIFIHELPKMYQLLWKAISNFDNKIVKKVNNIMGTTFSKNSYINNYAGTSYLEDFSECIEEQYLNEHRKVKKTYKWYLWVKMKVANALYNKYN